MQKLDNFSIFMLYQQADYDTSLSFEQILEELPDLELDDLKAALLYAVRKLDHPVLVA
jgi:uncharacterized protein (DUF433 family)